jgi:hypothetical protein
MRSKSPLAAAPSTAVRGRNPYVCLVLMSPMRSTNSRSGSGNGNGRKRTESVMLKTAVFAPTPSATVSTARSA